MVLEGGWRLSESKTEREKQLAGAWTLISPFPSLPEPAEGEPQPLSLTLVAVVVVVATR